MFDIIIIKLKAWQKEPKGLLEVVRQKNECTTIFPIQGHEYIVLGPIWPFEYTILVYNI
jgi:hypothetical protein